jgi:acetyltransferase-like isoleucine patch superfamily enzyme
MLATLKHWLRGLRLLRYPELTAWLGREHFRLQQVREIQSQRDSVHISDTVQLVGWRPELLGLSDGVSIGHGTVLAFGDEQNGFGNISIGKKSWIGEYNNLRSGSGEIRIGEHCLISQFVSIIASGHGIERRSEIMHQRPPEKRHVTIGDDVWIGAGATLLPGITVEAGAVIAAGAVVTTNVRPYSIVAGIPARPISERQ